MQYLIIGVAAVALIAGIAIGYGVLQSTTNSDFMNMTPQQMQTMMNDPNMMNQWHQTMMNDPQHMRNMMGPMMNTMMDDPDMQQQMMDHMKGHHGMMNTMNQMGCPMMNCPMMNP